MEEEILEHTLLVVREVNVYKVPPRSTSGGYKCAEWLVSAKIWSGRLRVVEVKEVCEIRLEDTNTGELFATCRVLPGQRDATVQNAVDSSRYFVLKIDDGRGRHAFIGLGFNERNEAFDFNVALQDHEKHLLNEKSKPPETASAALSSGEAGTGSQAPSSNFKLKEGETIKISVQPASAAQEKRGIGISRSAFSTASPLKPLAPPPGGGGGGLRLAPPPGAGGLKLAPPSAAAVPAQPLAPPSVVAQNGPASKPPEDSARGSAATGTAAAGWMAF